MIFKRPNPLLLTAMAGVLLAGCAPESAMEGGPTATIAQKPKLQPNNDPLARVLTKVGAKAAEAGEYATAVNFYERAHELDPGSVDPLLGLASAYAKAGHLREAAARYTEVLDLDAANRVALKGLDGVAGSLAARKAAEDAEKARAAEKAVAATSGTATAKFAQSRPVTATARIASAAPTLLSPAVGDPSAAVKPESRDPLLAKAALAAATIDGGESWASDGAASPEAGRMSPREGYQKVAEALELASARKESGQTAASSPADGFRVQIAAFTTRERAQKSLDGITAATDGIDSLRLTIEESDLGGAKGMVYRLRTMPVGDHAAADELCGKLKARGVDCFVVSPDGPKTAMATEKEQATPGDDSSTSTVNLIRGPKGETRKIQRRWIQEYDESENGGSGEPRDQGTMSSETEGATASPEPQDGDEFGTGNEPSLELENDGDNYPEEYEYVPDTADASDGGGELETTGSAPVEGPL